MILVIIFGLVMSIFYRIIANNIFLYIPAKNVRQIYISFSIILLATFIFTINLPTFSFFSLVAYITSSLVGSFIARHLYRLW